MDAPLYNTITALTGNYPMHMPGHKRNADFLPKDILKMDITEIDGSDNLHEPHGAISEAQQKMAELYGAEHSIFCVNGGTSGILAAILGTCGKSDTLLTVKNAHKSLQNALILSGAGAVYMNTAQSPYGFAMPAEPEAIEAALIKNKEIKAVFIISPTYEGFCADIEKIAEITHHRGKILIVDETHGAHFPFSRCFPKSALKQGADISITSWHKTLPVPNQCAVLNLGKNADIKKIRQAFSMVTTTSPSYIFMGLMDYVRAYYTENTFYFSAYTKKLHEIRNVLAELKNIRLADSTENRFDFDISKLTFVSSQKNINKAAELLESKYGFRLEMKGAYHFIAMTSSADDPAALDRFAAALVETDEMLDAYIAPPKEIKNFTLSGKIIQRDIFYSENISVPYKTAQGRIAADFVTPFPPDIPCIIAGEKISEEKLEELETLIKNGTEILGLENGMIHVLK